MKSAAVVCPSSLYRANRLIIALVMWIEDVTCFMLHLFIDFLTWLCTVTNNRRRPPRRTFDVPMRKFLAYKVVDCKLRQTCTISCFLSLFRYSHFCLDAKTADTEKVASHTTVISTSLSPWLQQHPTPRQKAERWAGTAERFSRRKSAHAGRE